MRKARWKMKILIFTLILSLLCPGGVWAQAVNYIPTEQGLAAGTMVATTDGNLTATVNSEGQQVTVQGMSTPDTLVTLLVTRISDGDRRYLDQARSGASGNYQFMFELPGGDYEVKVSSNGISNQQKLTVHDSRKGTVSVRVEGMNRTILPQRSIEIYDGETTILQAFQLALNNEGVSYTISNGMLDQVGNEQGWQWLLNNQGGQTLPSTPLKQGDQLILINGQIWNPVVTKLSLDGGATEFKSGSDFTVTLQKYSSGGYLPVGDEPVTFAGSTKYTNQQGKVTFRANETGTYQIAAQTEGSLIRPVPLTIAVIPSGNGSQPGGEGVAYQVKMRIEGYRGTAFEGYISFKPEDYKNKDTGKYEITDPAGKKYSFSYPTVLMATVVAWNRENIRDNKVTYDNNYVARMAGEEEKDFTAPHATSGWLVRVNDSLINQGVGTWEIKNGDTVEWFYGDTQSSFGYLSLSSTSLNTGEKLTAKVTAKGNGGMDGGDTTTRSAVSGATVYVGAETYLTDAKGEVEITLNTPGTFAVYADKVDPNSSYGGYNFPLMARTAKSYVTVTGPEVKPTDPKPTDPKPTDPKPTDPNPNAPSLPGAGESYNGYNRQVLAALENLTPEQQAGARLAEGSNTANPRSAQTTVLETADGVQITIPPGALGSQRELARFSVGVGQILDPPIAESRTLVLNPLSYQRQFDLLGQTGEKETEKREFKAPVILNFPVNPDDLPDGVTPAQLAIYRWDQERKDWIKLGGVYNPDTRTISLPTYHLSTYAVMADTASAPTRIAGYERYDTANQTAEYAWKAGADHVILVNAFACADALAAVPLAFKYNAPILYTDAVALTPSTLKELEKLNPKQITLIGGTSVISAAVETQLAQKYGRGNIVRYGGWDLYETAALIAKALGTTGKAVIANGGAASYADALAISSYAAYHGIPLLFTDRLELPAATAKALAEQKVESTVVVGGSYIVPEVIFRQLPGAVRYGGVDMYETAVMIARELSLNTGKVYVATGLNFADALMAGNLAARTLSPVVLVDNGIPAVTSGFLSGHKAKQPELIILGGEGIITKIQEKALRSAIK